MMPPASSPANFLTAEREGFERREVDERDRSTIECPAEDVAPPFDVDGNDSVPRRGVAGITLSETVG